MALRRVSGLGLIAVDEEGGGYTGGALVKDDFFTTLNPITASTLETSLNELEGRVYYDPGYVSSGLEIPVDVVPVRTTAVDTAAPVEGQKGPNWILIAAIAGGLFLLTRKKRRR